MKNEIKTILETVERKEQEKRDIANNREDKIKELTKRNAELSATIDGITDFDDLMKTKTEIKTNEQNIDFLIQMRNKPQGASITQDEYKEMQRELEKAAKDIQNESAEAIKTALMDAVKGMDEYTAKCAEINDLMNRLVALRNPKVTGSNRVNNQIIDVFPNDSGWFRSFVYMYYNNVNEIARAESYKKWHRGA